MSFSPKRGIRLDPGFGCPPSPGMTVVPMLLQLIGVMAWRMTTARRRTSDAMSGVLREGMRLLACESG